jgi:hypothetical protein
VEPDVLLFRKYPDDIRARLEALGDDTFTTTPLYDGAFVSGTYFETRPEHVLGERSRGTGQWGADEVTGDVTPESLARILEAFTPAEAPGEDVFEHIRSAYAVPYRGETETYLSLSAGELAEAERNALGEGAVKVYEKAVYLLTGNRRWLSVSEDEALVRKLPDVTAIAAAVKDVRDRMTAEADPPDIHKAQERCAGLLAAFRETHGTLPGEDADLKRFTRTHPAVKGVYEAFLSPEDPLLVSENVYRKKVELLDGHNTAIAALLLLREHLKPATEEVIRSAFPDTAEALLDAMRGHADIFYTPEGEYQLREDFIAGDAWERIDTLREAAEHERGWKQEKLRYGAAELEKAVGWTPIEDADFSPRSSWIPLEVVRAWAAGGDALGHGHLSDLAKNDEGKWGFLRGGSWNEHDPLVYYLNGQKQRSRNIDTEAYDKEHDELFRSFIANHEPYRALLEDLYNRTFKTHIVAPVKTYPVNIAGWKDAGTGGKTLKPHQWQSVHHLYRQRRGISALGTGFGKTATAAALMSLLRQEGKVKRVFLQVPNNKVKDWIEEIGNVMPSLKTAALDPEEPGYANRHTRYAAYQAMAGSDADVIIMPESAAGEIQLSAEQDRAVSERVGFLYRQEKENGTARQRELAAVRGEHKAASGKANKTICFEDFGCDCLIVDEAHRYKNLFSSALSRETGLNDGRQSAKAMALYKKCEYIRERNNGKNVFLLTATPLTNSPLEYYNMMQYIAPEELRRMGVSTIDGFIREFARIETGWIYDWGHGQAKQGRILTGFKNLSTLQNLFFTYTDLQNDPGAAGIEKPRSENTPHVIPADERQTAVIRGISAELDRYKALTPEERDAEFPGENFLTFYSRLRTASLDLELYDPAGHRGWNNPKLAALAETARESYRATGGGQVVFCDRVFSSDGACNIHDKIKAKLIEAGFKENEIAVVNGFTKGGGAKTDGAVEKEVSKAIAGYNAGAYKVLIGSTACIGEGVNLQKNSSCVHHFDIPFRPSDFIQRNGRVDRQGNEQKKVALHTYLAAGTIDNYSVSLVQRKAGWIDQLLRTTSEVFTNPNDENTVDADELLLALTEEWGDKEAARQRREEWERQKQEKIREAQTQRMDGQLKNLSLARGALEGLAGKEKTDEYRKRLTQIHNIETALKDNPVFKRPDLLGTGEPFLYGGGAVYRRGDVIVSRAGTFLVEAFNFKKRELSCTALLSREERRKQEEAARSYGSVYSGKRTFTLSELGEKGGYAFPLSHYETASEETRECIIAAGSKEFYRLPEAAKETWYPLHIAVHGERYGFDPVALYRREGGGLEVSRARIAPGENGVLLNPFSAGGRKEILEELERGIEYDQYDRDGLLEDLGETMPDLQKPVQTAIAARENREREEALKAELLKHAAGKTGGERHVTPHVKQHVRVTGVRF